MFVDRLDNYKIDNLRIMTKEMCKSCPMSLLVEIFFPEVIATW